MRLLRRFLLPLVIGAALLSAVFFFDKAQAVWIILHLFPAWVVALIVALILLCEVVKIARWHFFVRAAGIPMRFGDAATSLLAGQTACVLPGGDLLRIRLATEHGVPPRVGVTISFALWATDMMVLPLMALAGYGRHLVWPGLLFLPLAIPLLLIALVRSRRFAIFASRMLARFRLTRRFALSEAELAHVTHLLTRRAVLLAGMGYALVMRIIFVVVLLCITDVINDSPIHPLTMVSAHALSTLAGAFSFLGGLAAVGSLVEILNARGVSRVLGLLISLTNRVMNTAINVALGLLVLVTRYHRVLGGKHIAGADETFPMSETVGRTVGNNRSRSTHPSPVAAPAHASEKQR